MNGPSYDVFVSEGGLTGSTTARESVQKGLRVEQLDKSLPLAIKPAAMSLSIEDVMFGIFLYR